MLSHYGGSKPGLKLADGVETLCSSTQHEEEGATQQDEDQTSLMDGLIWPATATRESEPQQSTERSIIGHQLHHRQNVKVHAAKTVSK